VSGLTRAEVTAADSASMLDDVLDLPSQLEDALWRARSAEAPETVAPDGLQVCGMGGSAIGGDLARACIGDRGRGPIRVTRDFAPDAWTGEGTLVLLASYSGDTEETLACYEAAGAAGSPRVALTKGGELAAAARADGVPVIGVPAGLAPRAAVAYMTVGALECAALCGAAPRLDGEVEAASRLLGTLVDAWAPEGPDDSPPKEIARRLEHAVAVIYGAGTTAAVARRWKTQLNENAKVPAFFAELPEGAHNDICGFAGAERLARLEALFLHDRTHDDRVARRLELAADLVGDTGVGVYGAVAREDTAVERIMALVLCGDLASVYLAALRGVDPSTVEAIDDLKQALRASAGDRGGAAAPGAGS
jgi:glucose/mannose-6-phosphate isomerase